MSTAPRREAAINAGLAVAALAVGLTSEQNVLYGVTDRPVALRAADMVLGAGCFAGIWIWRSRRPVAFAVVAIAIGVVSTLAGGIGLICAFTVAEHRRWRTAVAVSALAALSIVPALALYPVSHAVRAFTVGALATFGVTGWGMFVRARRQLLDSLRLQLRDAEHRAVERAAAARRAERERIAREMHDVLAHRLSLLAVHAGALEYHRGASAEEVVTTAAIIRSNSHQALNELRQVINLLRAATPAGQLPQPTLADLPALLEESRSAGLEVSCAVSPRVLQHVEHSPASTGSTLYRVVQEALTNVRKHAPQARVRIEVYDTGDGIEVSVRNHASPAAHRHAAPPGSGTGLTGLRERVSLSGGRIEYQPVADDGYQLRAWMPCAATEQRTT
ncbi:sensor histidine kinase [Frankia sp. AiPa1]|uniref:sensor histidine kinase n=1 Tax=Frankia sp. AiPa1 TaxID=573492 RepID=UPI00202AEAA4|nr:histidine kinase [Frankia sp. AiPa1]MCL9758556.1 histidine kinase [Frankia sp. AiPa1]